MIGPVMIGPSSSHTAGVARIGRVGYQLLEGTPETAVITFYNSFATTYEGHGSDRAILGGLMNLAPDDERLRDALSMATASGIQYRFRSVLSAAKYHPNAVRLQLTRGEVTREVLGVSRGGGLITIAEVDGFHTNFTAALPTLVIQARDVRGSIAFIASVIAQDDCNIATMTVGRTARERDAMLVLEIDSPIRPVTLQFLHHVNWIRHVVELQPMGEAGQEPTPPAEAAGAGAASPPYSPPGA